MSPSEGLYLELISYFSLNVLINARRPFQLNVINQYIWILGIHYVKTNV